VRIGVGSEARVGAAEVVGDLVDRAALIDEQGCAGVAEVVGAKVGDAGVLERGDPDPAAPVLTPLQPPSLSPKTSWKGLGRPTAA